MKRSLFRMSLACAGASLLVSGLAFAPFFPVAHAAPAASADKAKPAQDKKGAPAAARNVPTRITSDNMSYEADQRHVIFTTNVHVSRPDFEMWSNKLTVYLKETPQAKEQEGSGGTVPEGLASGDIERIVATGNVRMKREKNTSTSEKATYTVDDEVLVLEGNPRLSDGENTITGEVVRYFMKENRSDVVGSSKKRVEAIFSTNGSSREGGR